MTLHARRTPRRARKYPHKVIHSADGVGGLHALFYATSSSNRMTSSCQGVISAYLFCIFFGFLKRHFFHFFVCVFLFCPPPPHKKEDICKNLLSLWKIITQIFADFLMGVTDRIKINPQAGALLFVFFAGGGACYSSWLANFSTCLPMLI